MSNELGYVTLEASARALPLPPYRYDSVDGALFVVGDEKRALLLARFRGTPVGDFDEWWEIEGPTRRITAIFVDNPAREAAGRLFWRMPKVVQSIAVSIAGANVQATVGARAARIEFGAVTAALRETALTFEILDRNTCELVLNVAASWHEARAVIDGTPLYGRALRIVSAAILQPLRICDAG